MKKFLVKCVLAVCITFCCLFYLDMMYEQKSDNPIAEINVFNFIPDSIQIANVGSSHGQCDFDWNSLTRERGIQTFNFALTSQSYEYDYALINMHKDDFAQGSLLFIPVSYFSFNQEATDPNDIEAISVRYYRLLSPQYNPDYSLYKDLVTVRFPILSAGEEIFNLFKPPILFPSLSENRQNIVYAAEASPEGVDGSADAPNDASSASSVSASDASSGTVLESQAAEAQDASVSQSPEEIYGAELVQEFEAKGYARYQRHFENKTEYFQEDKKQDLINLITLCKEQGITPILITTPFTQYYNQYVSPQFMYDFYTVINEIALEYGVSYYDYSHDERFQTNLKYFGDADHLNPDGAVYFTGLLMEEVAELKAYLETH